MQTWSVSDISYQCLLDFKRTLTLQSAIVAAVQPGDVVVNAGAGSGILSFFAASAGAKKVYSIEDDPLSATYLSQSVQANGFSETIEVVQTDICLDVLPQNVDLFISGMTKMGLIDDMQMPVINVMYAQNVIGSSTRLIPFRYETFMEVGFSDFTYYGYKVFIPKYDWSPHARNGPGRPSSCFQPHSGLQQAMTIDLTQPVASQIEITVPLRVSYDGLVNAVRISGRAHLGNGFILSAVNALNGDKILPLEEHHLTVGQMTEVQMKYQLGGGLSSLCLNLLQDEARAVRTD